MDRKKYWTAFLSLALAVSLTACSGTGPEETETEITVLEETETAEVTDAETAAAAAAEETVTETTETAATETTETAETTEAETLSAEQESETQAAGSNILIAYFTWAENTYVENPETVDVDATTSASVLPPGNAARLAGWIQEEVGGDLFSIVTTEPYSSNYDECLDRAAQEKADNTRPELVHHVENMEDYDIVFLGFPNWWYTVPMAVHTFLEEYDFSGKTIVPFVTHGTGGLSSTIEDITADLPEDVTILEPIGVYRPEVDEAQPAIQEWISGLNLEG